MLDRVLGRKEKGDFKKLVFVEFHYPAEWIRLYLFLLQYPLFCLSFTMGANMDIKILCSDYAVFIHFATHFKHIISGRRFF